MCPPARPARTLAAVFCASPRVHGLPAAVSSLRPSFALDSPDLSLDACLLNFADELCWAALIKKVDALAYDAALIVPPSGTFSGPSGIALRSRAGPTRYGLKGLTHAQNESLRMGTLLAVRAASLMERLVLLDIPFIFVTEDRHSALAPCMTDLRTVLANLLALSPCAPQKFKGRPRYALTVVQFSLCLV